MFRWKKQAFAAETERTCFAGEEIVHEGDAGSTMYIIQSGRVAVVKQVGDHEVVLTELGKGEFFGEMSLLEGLPRSATVRTIEETRLLVIEHGGLLLKISRDPTLAFEILQQLSSRVRRLTDMLTDALLAAEHPAVDAGLSVSKMEFARPPEGDDA